MIRRSPATAEKQLLRVFLGGLITVAVLGKIFWGGAWPLILFGRQQHLSEITIEPKKISGAGQDLGACAPWPQPRTATG